MNLTITEFKEFVADRYDPDIVVELLEITTEQLLAAFEDELLVNACKFNIEIEVRPT